MRKILGIALALFLLSPLVAFAASDATTCDPADCVLLLHKDGADASTTFTDSSDSAHTITVTGNAQVDTAQSKFGGASGLYDGSGDYIQMPSSTDWNFGTGDFTVDFWVRFAADPSGEMRIFDLGSYSSGKGLVVDYYSTSFNVMHNGNAGSSKSYAFTPSTDTWYHVAITRSGSSERMFVDGTQIGTTQTTSEDIQSSTYTPTIGSWTTVHTYEFNGWVDEFRVVKGTAVWTSNFTPPTAEYGTGGDTFTPKITWFN